MLDVSKNAQTLLAALLLASCIADEEPNQTSQAGDLTLVSSNGITVGASRWISARTVEVDISTPLISAGAVNGPHRIRVTLPNFYDQNPNAKYPVVYLLHGGAGGNSAQWTTGGGAAEHITVGKPVIVVMPDGGKVGWFTNWVDQSKGAQRWADFYLTQVIPWVDTNFRTVAAKQGRAISGLSMGGYGAVRLAQDRPDLFASVASLSGAVDLGDLGTRTVVTEQAIQHFLPAYGPFGSPFWPNDKGWTAADPMKRPTKLLGLQVLLYAGGGNSDFDILERTMGQSADRFAKTLAAAGVPHFWWMYGRPGPSAPFGCDGGHNFGCWNFAFNDAVPRMLSVLQVPTLPPPPLGTNVAANGGFESGLASWDCWGRCGADTGAFARTGTGNGWVRSDAGWNDLHQAIPVVPNRTYVVTAWIRTSANNVDGFFGLRAPDGKVLGEKRFGSFPGYTQVSVSVNSGANHALVVFGGMWANGDTWIQLDDVTAVGN
ncbi:MAG TPA: alpha/beta hydrolase family protein [Kofleriaceae bacterium]